MVKTLGSDEAYWEVKKHTLNIKQQRSQNNLRRKQQQHKTSKQTKKENAGTFKWKM